MPSNRFANQAVIVTGSSQGIGRETARMFAEEGAKVTITGRNEKALEETKQILLKAGAKPENILIVSGNLMEEATQKKIVDETVTKFGKIDILINNAGAAGADGGSKSGFNNSMEDFDYIINLNLRSVVSITKIALPHLEKAQGSVVNVSSIAATEPSAWAPYYGMAKAGLDHCTRNMAIAFIGKGVRVNCVNPGLTRTKFMDAMGVPKAYEDNLVENMCTDRSQLPIGRAAQPHEVGTLILFLADRSQSEYIIGQCIVIDGGRSLARPVVAGIDNAVSSK